ncbi:hypothetical protein ACFE04_012398 [Oxalis oulophora]
MTAEVTMDMHTTTTTTTTESEVNVANELSSKQPASIKNHDLSNENANAAGDHVQNGVILHDKEEVNGGGDNSDFLVLNGQEEEVDNNDGVAVDRNFKKWEDEVVEEIIENEEVLGLVVEESLENGNKVDDQIVQVQGKPDHDEEPVVVVLQNGKEESAQIDDGLVDSTELNSLSGGEPQTEEIVVNGSVSDENGVGAQPSSIDDQAQDTSFDSADKIPSEQNTPSEDISSLSSHVVCENGVVECADESLTFEISSQDNSTHPKVVGSDQSVETASFPAAHVQTENGNLESHAYHENGDAGLDKLPESDLIDANKAAPEQNGHSDINGAGEGAENSTTTFVDQIVETASFPAADGPSENDISESRACDEIEEGLPTGISDDKLPESDLSDADKAATEQNGHSDVTLAAEDTENLPIAPVDEMVVPEIENGVCEIAQEILVSADDNESGTEAIKSDLKSVETAISHSDDFIHIESEWEVVKADLDCETEISHSVDSANVESGNAESESKVVKGDLESCETAVPHPVDCTSDKSANVESEVNGSLGDTDGDANMESEIPEAVTEDSESIPVDDTVKQSEMTVSVQNESHLTASPIAGVKSEPEIDNAPVLSDRDIVADETVNAVIVDDTNNESKSDQNMPSNDIIVPESLNVNVSDINNECASNSGQNGEVRPEIDNGPAVAVVDSAEAELEKGAVHLASEDNDNKTSQEIETPDASPKEETSTSCPEGSSTVDASEKQNVVVERRPFNFMIRVPRYDDESLKEQIRHAQFQVEQKTERRDVVRVEIQKQRGVCKECGAKFDTAIAEERAARDLLKSKRKEMDAVQVVINKVKDAMSIEDIDVRLHSLEHMISHETQSLKEEKQMIREIKQMKQLREQITSNMGDDVQQALDQKDEIQDRLKALRKEADSLRANVLKAEAVTQAAKKKYYDEGDNLSELQAKFREADDIRQEAYIHLQSVRKQLNEKNKYFWQYKDDFNAANDLLRKGDKDAIQNLCVNQVERFMKLWNEDDEFRKEYIRCNTRSTLRRLRTLDGRSLGPDEKPPVIPSFPNPRIAKNQTMTPISISGGERQEQTAPVETNKKDDKPADKIVEPKLTVNSKKSAKPSANGLVTVPGPTIVDKAREEELKQSKEEEEEELKRRKEEEELARKAEELRKAEEAAKLKEQCRLEEKAKAIEALERKKRQAEKAQARAALRAQKDAEQKEREKEKRLRKKEKRKTGATTVDINVTNEEESAPLSEPIAETPREPEKSTISKRSKKSSQFTKQLPKASIPPPLRNRGKRRMQTWMWALLAALIVFGLFMLGNSSSSFNFGKIF